HYTRPQMWQGKAVPPVLLSGNHEEIRRWRHAAAERATQERRADLWQHYLARQEQDRAQRKVGDFT
ncbi:MAG: tRNA (guanosine(37)-N1)-methyltransferase TrmD, partial [Stellaceae bacterium]